MLDGTTLTLLVGPAVPAPAPRSVVDALTRVEVTSGTTTSGFQLTFTVGKTSPLLTTLLPAGYLDPVVTRVIIVATVRGVPNVLMDGVVARQELQPSNEPGKSTLTVTGEDLSMLMDLVEMPFMRYPAMPEAAQLRSILARYAGFGIVPVVVPPVVVDPPSPTDRIPTHVGTDLEYIRLHALRSGYVFYVEPGPAPGLNIAYFGPDVRVPLPQPALNVNMDAHSNVESLTFALDGNAKKVVVLTTYDPVTRRIPTPVPVPDLSIVRPPLGARPLLPRRVEFMNETAKLSTAEAARRALGVSLRAQDAITGSGTLDVTRYGRVLRSRMLVGVRGAGIAYDGLYYVSSVSHTLERGAYRQSFSLSRDGLVSLTPRVPP